MIELFENSNDVERLRTRNRIMFESEELAEWLWQRISKFYEHQNITDKNGDEWEVYGLNNRFRMVRYDENDEFAAHEDGWYTKDFDDRSFSTAMIYLNTVPIECGGATTFLDHSIRLQPSEGLGFIFVVDGIFHRGEPIVSGKKYILRTDVMYKATKLRNPELKKDIYDLYTELDNVSDDMLNDPGVQKKWAKYFEMINDYKIHEYV